MRLLAFSFSFMTILLSGCAGLAQWRDSAPLRSDREVFLLPAAAELSAAVTLSAREVSEEYLLALHSGREAFQGALLTPAGINVANLDFSAKKQAIATVVSMGELLSPAQLVAYLELIYSPVATLRNALKDGWCLEEGTAQRHFFSACDGAVPQPAFSIRYSGDAPWYATITLQDHQQHRVLQVRVLEVSNVLSE